MPKTSNLTIEKRALSSLIPDPNNARTHDKKNLDAISASLKRFGQVEPLVIRKSTGVIVGGNGRVEAMRSLGWTECSVVELELTDAEAKALAISLNRSAELADWSKDLLGIQLQSLREEGWDLADIGFSLDDLPDFNVKTNDYDDETEDEVPEVKTTDIKRGDLFELGRHRVLCGDSTCREDVERLMAGEKSDLCFTSPPYAQQRDYGAGRVNDWDTLMSGVFKNIPLSDNGQILVNLGLVHRENEWLPYWNNWLEKMAEYGWRRFGFYIWDQGPGLPGDWNGRLAPSFELIFHFNKTAKRPKKWIDKLPENIRINDHGTGLRGKDGKMSGVYNPESALQPTKIPDNVIRIMRHKARNVPGHPAMFPVELPLFFINSWSGLVYEPFLGSGSTMIACEKAGRRCFGSEIDPQYCQVIIDRYKKYTGRDDVRKVG